MLRITHNGMYKGICTLQMSTLKEGGFILFSKVRKWFKSLSMDNAEFLFIIIHITDYIYGHRVPKLRLLCFSRKPNYMQLINTFHKQKQTKLYQHCRMALKGRKKEKPCSPRIRRTHPRVSERIRSWSRDWHSAGWMPTPSSS